MDAGLIKLNELKTMDNSHNMEHIFQHISKKDIAVIGMACRVGSALNVDEFWNDLIRGKDFIRALPENRRKKNEEVLDRLYGRSMAVRDIRYNEWAYLEHIDRFDHSFFNLSPKEANLMDPNQRLFLQTVWEALEEAGYGGNSLSGSRTGVFVGFSSDSYMEYKNIINLIAPSSVVISRAGNIKSIIGSRIAYILDFKGPSMLVDTACSSALVAVHLACQAIRNGECSMAVAGGVKIEILNLKGEQSEGLGIESSTGRTRTFDDSSDGTGGGEGVGAVLLKPLYAALDDGDHIHAVIKGSAINQDGTSVGITAPNSAAQEDVILRAWKDSGVSPETITYIEAHGTGTKLGDPIEISSITKAFRNYTEKRQFCAVTSVKTNIGHLDHAAGIAGLIKAICALKHGQIPASLHFQKPNSKIAFEELPVYVNDKQARWVTDIFPRRCGVSSFGLSGTNCHMILEQAPAESTQATAAVKSGSSGNAAHILALSAKSEEALKTIVARYREYLGHSTWACLEDVCYTTNTGRGHYNFRIAVRAMDIGDLSDKLEAVTEHGFDTIEESGIYYGRHNIVSRRKETRLKGEILQEEKVCLDREAAEVIRKLKDMDEKSAGSITENLCRLYISGAEIDWEGLYRGRKFNRLSLPTYPFHESLCWVEAEKKGRNVAPEYTGDFGHPLIHGILAESFDSDLYLSELNTDTHWVLNEHKVYGNYTVPGSAYIEMVGALGRRYYPGLSVELKDVIFIAPLSLKKGESVVVHTVVKHLEGYKEFTIASRIKDGEWQRHAQGMIFPFTAEKLPDEDIMTLMDRFKDIQAVEFGRVDASSGPVETGPRWENLKKAWMDENEGLACMELKDDFKEDLDSFSMHPALLDCAVNLGKPDNADSFYLPLSYKSMKIYRPMTQKFYNYIKKKSKAKESIETASFEIKLLDESGRCIADIGEYTVKRVPTVGIGRQKNDENTVPLYKINWIPLENDFDMIEQTACTVLILKSKSAYVGFFNDGIAKELVTRGCEVIEVELGEKYLKADDWHYIISNTEDDYLKLFSECKSRDIGKIIHTAAIAGKEDISDIEAFETGQKYSVFSLFHVVKALLSNRYKQELEIALVADYAYNATIDQESVNPLHAAMFGLARVISLEHANIKCRCFDIEEETSADMVIQELYSRGDSRVTAFRGNLRYIEELERIGDTGIVKNKSEIEKDKIKLKDTGAYIITGGTGGIGLEIAALLASKAGACICLVNRSKIPEREEWDAILDAKENIRLCNKLKRIRQIEHSGAKLSFYHADVANQEEMEKVVRNIRNDFGKIHGIVHGAGVAGNGFIMLKKEETFNEVLAPKTTGTWILHQLTKDDNLDFFIMFSSVATIAVGQGQGDYTAANAFLDSFASYRSRKYGRTLAVNWPAWSETGMAFDNGITDEESIFTSLTTGEAIDVFEHLLNTTFTRVIPVKIKYDILNSVKDSLPLRLSANVISSYYNGKPTLPGKQQPVEKEPALQVELTGKLKGDYNEYEKKVAWCWSCVLGLKEINIYEGFNQVGGDSILATRLLRELEKEFTDVLDITDIFSYPTVSELAEYIEKQFIKDIPSEMKESTDEDMDEILKKLSNGEMSPEEADRLIKLEE